MRQLRGRVGAASPQSANVVGCRRSGKSSLLRYLRDRPAKIFGEGVWPLIVSLDFQQGCFQTPEGVWEGVRRGIAKATGQVPWTPEQAAGDPFAVVDGLEAVREAGWRLVVVIDEFEAIAQKLPSFQSWGEDWRAKSNAGLLTTAIATSRPLSEVYRSLGLTSPFDNIFSMTILGPLAEGEWRRLVGDRLPQVSEEMVVWIDAVAGGWPFYVQMAGAMLWQWGNLTAARGEFPMQARSTMVALWEKLTAGEREVVRLAACGGAAADQVTIDRLQRFGILRANGQLFSEVFRAIVLAEI